MFMFMFMFHVGSLFKFGFVGEVIDFELLTLCRVLHSLPPNIAVDSVEVSDFVVSYAWKELIAM